MISHSDALKLIGEIDGITLRSTVFGVAVDLIINGKSIQIIVDNAEVIDHHITRIGILDEIDSSYFK